ncbi:MAG: hypothetical protein KBF73_04810 [Flavobacteriales bacterium]|nr:hypothetical protein [Flavobacteriales bacterium]
MSDFIKLPVPKQEPKETTVITRVQNVCVLQETANSSLRLMNAYVSAFDPK